MNKPDAIILLGGPASGKGTQAKVLAKRIGYSYFGAGDLLRAEVETGSETGKKIAKLMDGGELVPDELVDPLINRKIKELKKSGGIVLDGYPRNIDQAANLQDIFPDENFLVLNIEVSSEELMNRMMSRKVCDQCGKIITAKAGETKCDCGGNFVQRSDDTPEILKKRVETYEERTAPIMAYYREKGLVKDIDGQPPIPEVTKEIERVI